MVCSSPCFDFVNIASAAFDIKMKSISGRLAEFYISRRSVFSKRPPLMHENTSDDLAAPNSTDLERNLISEIDYRRGADRF